MSGPTVPFRYHHRPPLNSSASENQPSDHAPASRTDTLCALLPPKTHKSSASITSTNATKPAHMGPLAMFSIPFMIDVLSVGDARQCVPTGTGVSPDSEIVSFS